MSPSNRKSSLNRETTSCIQNKNRKRSFLRTSENDNDIYYKRKKSIKHSQVDINNAILTSPNGYMTRNKLNKHLTNNSELVETNVIENKCSRINNISYKSETVNKKAKSSNKIHKKMTELGFVFTDDILSQYPGKQVDTKCKKSIPSLFESDSDPEIDYFRIKDGIKNEVKELSTCISYPDDVCPAFDKNVEMRTYFNKKSYPINNKSNIKSLNIVEEIIQEPKNVYNHVKTVDDSNLCDIISQNYNKTKKSLKVTGPTTSECIQTNTKDDDVIIVTESFIRQLKNEFEMIKSESQSIENKTQKLLYDNNTINFNNSDIEQHKDNTVVSKKLSSNFEVNQVNVFNVDTNFDDICDVNSKSSICSNLSSKQDMAVIDESHKFIPSPSPFKTANNVENSLMSIFDEPKENILVESYANMNNSLIFEPDSDSSTTLSEEVIGLSNLQTLEFNNSNSNQSIENQPKSEKNITCSLSPDLIKPNQYFLSTIKDDINMKIESFSNKGNSNSLLKTDNSSSTNNSSPRIDDSKTTISEEVIGLSSLQTLEFNYSNSNNVENSLMSIFDEPKENILVESYANVDNSLIIEPDSDSSTTISEEVIGLSSLQTLEFNNSNSNQSIENQPKSEKNITCHLSPDLIESNQYFLSTIKDDINMKIESFSNKGNSNSLLKTDNSSSTNNSSPRNDDSKTTISEEVIGLSSLQTLEFNNSNSNQSVENHLKSEKNITCSLSPDLIKPNQYFLSTIKDDINMKIESFSNKGNSNSLLKTDNSSSTDNSSPKYDDNCYSKCYCKSFISFNTNDNKIFISKIKHFAFNNNANTIRQNKLHKKHLEANILNTLITKEYINIIQSKEHNIPIFNSISIDKKYEKCTDLKEKDHIEPSILNILKDVYVDVEYLPEYCDYNTSDHKLSEPQNNNKDNNIAISNNTSQNQSIDLKVYDGKYDNFYKNKTISVDNLSISNTTTTEKPINIKPCDERDINFDKNKTNSSKINFVKQNDFECDSACNSLEIDTKSKIKVEDDSNYETTAMKYNFKSEKSPKLDFCHLSNSTMIINKNKDSKEELEMLVKCKDIESENILSSVKINTNHGLTQTKISHILKDEHTPVPAIIDNENERNISTFFEPPQFKNVFDTSDTISSKEYQIFPTLPHISENNAPVNKLFNLPDDDIDFSINNISSDDDDDDRLLIEDSEQNIDGNIDTNSTCILKSADNSSKNDRKINCLSSTASIKNITTEIEFCEKKPISPIKKQSSEINLIKNKEVSNPILPKNKCVISNNNCEIAHLLEEEKNYLDDCMSFEMCNELYKLKSSQKNIVNKNESLPKYIKDILKEMYVDELFVSACQHMVDLYDDDDQSKRDVVFQTNECRKTPNDKLVCDINTNGEEKIYSEYNQSVPTNVETLWRSEINYGNQENNTLSNPSTEKNNSVSLQKPNELRQPISTKEETIFNSEIIECKQQKNPIHPTNTTQKSNSLEKPKNFKSNIKIRIHLREFIQSNKPLDKILESKEFRNLRFFSEEEIASSICVFIFEKTIDTPIITGLSVYRVNYDQLNNEEKNKILASTNLNITCPKILMLTSITLALVKMLRSDTLIEAILNYIRKNVLTKKINTDHTIDDQLIKQVVYFVDICVRLRRLKTLQIFIFDSMVFLPNKYCCIIFISLLLWKNCLPRSISVEEDPVIITVMSFLIARKKLYSEQTVGCDIFQRELINLLSCHFNYTFSIDMPSNFIQHIHKPDFFVSVVMFLKCCDPKDLVEFMVNSLFPIIDNYLNTQQNEMHAIQTMESINMAIKPFKITCNITVTTYLKKCKDPINGFKKNGKEHIYITAYNSYKILQNKFIEYLNDNRPRSQFFEELLMAIILVLGSADYLTSCISLMQWKPKFELSAVLSKKIVMFKSIIGDNILWNKLCAIDDIDRLKCLVNSCLLDKDVYNTIIQLHNLR